MIGVIILLLLALWMLSRTMGVVEGYGSSWLYPSSYPTWDSRWYPTSAWYPISSGTTRNMSYDIRGDVPIPYSPTGPWNQSSIAPIVNRPMTIGA